MLSPPTRQLLALLGPERGRWMLVGGLMSASALGEVAAPYFTGRVTDRVAQEDAAAAVWPLVLVGLSSAITELACDSMAAVALTRARERLQRGAVAERVTGDAEATHSALADVLVSGLWALTRAVSLLATMIWLSPALGLLPILAVPLFVVLPHKVGRIEQDLARQVRTAYASTTAVALESLGAIGTVRAFGHEAGVTARVRQSLAHGYRLQQKEALAYAAGLWASGAVLWYLPALAKAIGSSETLLELLEQARTEAPAGPLSPVTPLGDETTWTRGLCLKDVWMSYPGRSEPVLKGVSLSLRPGDFVAVLAPPGGGKSSLVAAALGLRPLGGRGGAADGVPLTPGSDPALRQQVAGVLQCPSILSRSLSANITLGWGHKEGTQVTAAARRVGVHTWAQQLPHGYDTEVGPRGMQLSGGQAQGVALARALLRNPRVLVLDDPTRSLDPVTRHKVSPEMFLCPPLVRVTMPVTLELRLLLLALALRGEAVSPPLSPAPEYPSETCGAALADVLRRLRELEGHVKALRGHCGDTGGPQAGTEVPWVTPRLASRTPTSLRITWPQPPVPPDGYRVTLVPLLMQLQWSVPKDSFDSFMLQYRDAQGQPQALPIDGRSRSVTVPGLSPSHRYRFHLYGLRGWEED
ncbi:hypothetical protein DUI87_35278 [Hirundo rustica rustica]|uniref:Fibronectin type-III domain-containing protein n=1 Tax=Hirundo rustica rustica TaxID=333673 RepID=A0A3M0J137_HIRRU|nr:hypothetical protein DUI87_35278 [Hirundo rustica rustica]